ncbi:transcriptional repressor [Candidatus Pelagibacter sp.]|jgi:Fur family iron response transcriptional regulator|nr:transcriptional repressor [Candidatus Pelagibacter sp.]|tara:strand:+ start:309 stop:725 length:417 start_codon:yes stop_codon:yes gene_type:complete
MTYDPKYENKLRESGLRPTKQRIKICEVLFNSTETFHFTIKDLVKIIENQANIKVSLATVYNTVHAFNKKGYLKEIPINSSQSYYDTNISHHHHFFDEDENKLIDIDQNDVDEVMIKKTIPGKKIKSIEVIAKIVTDN